MARPTSGTPKKANSAGKRTYLKQSDVPMASLDDALRVAEAIFDHYAGKPTSPLHLAKALNLDPKGSQLKLLTGAAMAFGLIEGGAQASSISVTDLARRILRPKQENEDQVAKREAILKPRIFGDFLRQYEGHPFPRQDIAVNVLEEMGVPRAKAPEVLERIDGSARSVGFIEEIKGKNYVSLQGSGIPAAESEPGPDKEVALPKPEATSMPPQDRITVQPPVVQAKSSEFTAAIADDQRRRRVFITHGKNRDIVQPIRKLLEYGELEAVVSVDRQSVSKPVPEKVMDDMRKAGAAIIHVDVDRTITDKDGTDHILLNPNVLIEIGAAMAFYGRRFILLVRDGVKLPSNLQGLYEVRYTGSTLDATSTIKLLEAIKDIKNYALPSQSPESES
jgi:predicted nucleotide-binding protein